MKRVLTSAAILVVAGCGSGSGGSGTAGNGATGSAGTSGAAGTGGTSATAGTGGTSATAGTGGTSATAGTGGTSGAAGGGGAGATGTAGRGGTGQAGRGGTGGSGSGGSGTCSGPGSLKYTMIATGLTTPVYVTQPAGETRLFVVEQTGRIRVIRDGGLIATPFLDARSSSLGDPPITDGEKGLLGLAFHPQYASNGRFFVFYNRRANDPFTTGSEGDIVVAEGQRSTNADVANPTLRPLFVLPQTRGGHTGGMLAFGPDGNLYIANGDAVDSANSQNPNSKFGKILRVSVGTAPPATPNLDPTVVHLGLRNPWRFSFDRANGDMYIADVGERLREEIDFAAAGTTGLNFGWPIMEGSMCSNPGCSMAGLTLPIYDYGRSDGQVVTGGYVYRGSNISCLRGRYIFADYNATRVWSFLLSGGQATAVLDHSAQLNITQVSSFGEDAAGELYVTILEPGAVYRIDPG